MFYSGLKSFRRGIASIVCLLGLNHAYAGSVSNQEFIFGADISSLPFQEKIGSVYKHSDGTEGDAVVILKEAGMNCMRLRLFVEPVGNGVVVNDLEYTLKLAKRIKEQGLSLLLDIHYSDTWADPSHQDMPRSWEGLQGDALYRKIEQYTESVLKQFIQEGVSPDLVQLGNEITNGMLWPEGKVDFSEPDVTAWDHLGEMLKAARQGYVKAYDGLKLPVNILHIESVGNLSRTHWYLEQLMARGLSYDVIGFSYYPQWHGDYDDLRNTLNLAVEMTGSNVMVMETACPWRETSDWSDLVSLPRPFTPESQDDFINNIIQIVKSVPDGKGCGIFWWYPESVETKGSYAWYEGDCALFDNRGIVLPAASAIKETSLSK